jgi:putative ATP-dependent endonuclease of OLD family
MYLSEIAAKGFRCFGPSSPLQLQLRQGLNILVGPNDAGKTAILDAPRYVLWTRGDDYQRLDETDFHVGQDGKRVRDLLIRCTFDGLSESEEARFLEWCSNEGGRLRLHLCLRGTLRSLAGGGPRVGTQYRAGKEADGPPLDGDLREHLRTTYLRPLRDAERELRPGRRSRLSRILGAMPEMAAQASPSDKGEQPTLVDTIREAEEAVDRNSGIKAIQDAVNRSYLERLSFSDDPLTAKLNIGARGTFDQILERLELCLESSAHPSERVGRGLGYNNMLFMAAELLLLQSHPDQLPLLLIEEPEAHLHPQHQALFMQLLEERAAPPQEGEGPRQQVQVLLTTHSPQLASSADLDTLTMVVDRGVYGLRRGQTKLDESDYGFLRRFLDATKANLFFARGLVVVEGDAENILVPAIAKKLGKGFGKHGVSMVNVGHRGLFRYSRILQRADGSRMPIPVALIPDRDIPPDCAGKLVGDRSTESMLDAEEKAAHLRMLRADEGGSVEAFPSDQWTLEFDLARRPALAALVHQAVQLAKGTKGRSREQVISDCAAEVERWRSQGLSADDIAVEIFTPLHRKTVSKTMAAEQLAFLIGEIKDEPEVFSAKLPPYLVAAIEHATRTAPARPKVPPERAEAAGGVAG